MNAIRIKREIWDRDETSMSNLKSQTRSVNQVTGLDVFSLGMCANLVDIQTAYGPHLRCVVLCTAQSGFSPPFLDGPYGSTASGLAAG